MVISKYYLIQYENQTILSTKYLPRYLMTPTKQKSNFQNILEMSSSQSASALLFFSPSSQVFLTPIAASSLSLPSPGVPL